MARSAGSPTAVPRSSTSSFPSRKCPRTRIYSRPMATTPDPRRRPMTRSKSAPVLPLAVVAAIAAAAACNDTPTAAEGTCAAVVNVHSVFFTESSAPTPAAETVSPEPYLTVTRRAECLDQGETGDPLAHGESSFLAVGTTLHQIEGHGPEERLAVKFDAIDEWRVLAPLPEV